MYVLTRVVSVWNASTLRSHITCMYSLLLSPKGILISIGGECLRGRAKAAVRIIGLVQPLLVILVRLWHGSQFQGRQRRVMPHVVRGDLVGRIRNVDQAASVRIRNSRREPRRQFEGVRRV